MAGVHSKGVARYTMARPASCWCPAPYPQHVPDVRREVRLSRKRDDRAYVKSVIHELEQVKQRSGFLSALDATRLRLYQDKLRRLQK
jgi:hypothetical protein